MEGSYDDESADGSGSQSQSQTQFNLNKKIHSLRLPKNIALSVHRYFLEILFYLII
jgi:hypothetical protein